MICNEMSRFDLLGADTEGEGMPFCPPTGSRRNGLGPVMVHAPVAIRGLVVKGRGKAAVAMSRSWRGEGDGSAWGLP